MRLPRALVRMVCTHANWPVDKPSGLQKWRRWRAFKTEFMRTGVHARVTSGMSVYSVGAWSSVGAILPLSTDCV